MRRAFPIVAGSIVALASSLVLVGWLLDIGMLKSVFPGWVSMKPNTAAGLLLCGVTLALLTREKIAKPIRLFTMAVAVAVIAMAALTLSEYLFGFDFGIDQILFRDTPSAVKTSDPGRMSPSSAFCLVLAGSALLVASRPGPAQLRVPFLKTLGMAVAVIGGFALAGYAADLALGYRWWNYSAMAMHTAVSFVLLGCGLLGLQQSKDGAPWSLDRWTSGGFVIGIALMLMAVSIAYSFTVHLLQTATWVAHRQAVLRVIQEVSADIASLESGQRGYIITGDKRLLEGREQTKVAVKEGSEKIGSMAASSPSQQRNAAELQPLIAARIDWEEQTISTLRQQGFPAAAQMIATGTGFELKDNIRRLLKTMRDEEYALLDPDQKRAERASTETFLLLPLGAYLSLTTLLAGLFFLNAGVGERVQAEKALRESEARKSAVMESALDCIITADHEGRVTEFNPRAQETFGYTRAEVLGKELTQTIIPPAFRESHSRGLAHYLATGEGPVLGRRIEVTAMRADGSEIPIELAIYATHLKGRPMFTAYLRDITERKQAEDKIRQLNAELERRVAELQAANKELDSFCYSVSHDLRTPLRGIAGFSKIVAETYSKKLDDSGRNYLQRVLAATKRMGELIDDLLKLSRVSREDFRRAPMNLSDIALAIAGDLRQGAPQRDVQLAIEDGLEVEGDSRLLRAMLENLLGNAWKFTSKKSAARIEFGSTTESGNGRVYYIRDNGAGFDKQYAGKLFGPFQRLHGQEEFPGTGIGLATVQRIINRHGGRIWADGKVDEGATFYFTV